MANIEEVADDGSPSIKKRSENLDNHLEIMNLKSIDSPDILKEGGDEIHWDLKCFYFSVKNYDIIVSKLDINHLELRLRNYINFRFIIL